MLQARLPRWSRKSIAIKAISMGMHRKFEGNVHGSFWKKEDDARLLQHFYSASNEELQHLFPQRSLRSILSKARRLGLKRRVDPDAIEMMGSVSEHHAELAQKYFGQQPPKAKTKMKDYSPYLQAIRDWAVSLALQANCQNSPLRREGAKRNLSSQRLSALAVREIKP